jgi:signal transduction histidine kinase/DNA-binding response OmpR family regulator/CHASE3 domain sensor protein
LVDSLSNVARTNLSRSLAIALVTPIVLLLLLGTVLAVQVRHMSVDARWVDHTDEVIADATELDGRIYAQESALRGFLLSGDPRYVADYEIARPLDTLVTLRALTMDNPQQQARLDRLQRRYEQWRALLPSPLIDADRAALSRPEAMRERTALISDVREALRAVLDGERTLRFEREQAAARSESTTQLLFLGLFVLTALALYAVSRRQFRAINATYGDALQGERVARAFVEEKDWLGAGALRVAESMQGEPTIEQLGERILRALASHCGADVGAFFTRAGGHWKRCAGYALDTRAAGPDAFVEGEGVVGRAAIGEGLLVLRGIPAAFLKVRSGTGQHESVEVGLLAARTDKAVHAIVELGFLRPPAPRVWRLLEDAGESIALATRSVEHRTRLRELFEESQRQAAELQTQQEELRVANEELEQQRNVLREAHGQLKARQDELESSNVRLQDQASALETAQRAVLETAEEAERASRYKSQFLANMSHELRTPLNSSLILAKLLADNKEGNLTEEQVKYAALIHASGNDLLALITDVLDLSKIEAGRVDVRSTPVQLSRLVDSVIRPFEPLARERGLALEVHIEASTPDSLDTDPQRVGQVLKNLISNALKFTEEGRVSVTVRGTASGVAFDVSDTGVGVSEDEIDAIFEAFRQGGRASSRKGGGTGLGLSISRHLARLLGGDVTVRSEPGRGSTFTLALPLVQPIADRVEPRVRPRSPPPVRQPAASSQPPRGRTRPRIEDDREHLDGTRRLVLVIEDDVAFATILIDVAHERQFQCLVAHDAESGMDLAARHGPSAILLDVNLPDQSGLSVLDRLKRDPRTRHVPVHIISVADHAQSALSMGAVGYIVKPAEREQLVAAFQALEERFLRRVRRILIVEDDPTQRVALRTLLASVDVEVVDVSTVAEALEALGAATFDCMVTDLSLPDASGFDLLERIAGDDTRAFPPVIVYTGGTLTTDQEHRLRRYASSIVVKGARSPERLVAEVALFLHQVEAELPAEHQRLIRSARDREAVFEGRTVLVVEDDVRNVFALTSLLERKGATVLLARNGLEALEVLEAASEVDLALMDVMMPEMDGLEATRRIRKSARHANLPIIALTAKAMKDDRDECLRAGANDYAPKPLDVDRLLSLVRVWMPR